MKLGHLQWGHLQCMTIQSAVSQKEKNKNHVLTIYMESRKMYSWTYLQGRNRDPDIENRLMDTVGEGEGETIWESGHV